MRQQPDAKHDVGDVGLHGGQLQRTTGGGPTATHTEYQGHDAHCESARYMHNVFRLQRTASCQCRLLSLGYV